jgi:hypothetical protein
MVRGTQRLFEPVLAGLPGRTGPGARARSIQRLSVHTAGPRRQGCVQCSAGLGRDSALLRCFVSAIQRRRAA